MNNFIAIAVIAVLLFFIYKAMRRRKVGGDGHGIRKIPPKINGNWSTVIGGVNRNATIEIDEPDQDGISRVVIQWEDKSQNLGYADLMKKTDAIYVNFEKDIPHKFEEGVVSGDNSTIAWKNRSSFARVVPI